MADSMLARPSFWKVPREFTDRSHSPSNRFVVYDSHDQAAALSQRQQEARRGRSTDRPDNRSSMFAQQRSPSPCRLHHHQVQGLSSASDAGIQKGDVLLSVNRQPVHGQTLQNISDQVHRDGSNTMTIGISRPSSSLDRSRPMSPFSNPSSPIPGAVTQAQVHDLFRPLPRSPLPQQARRYDPSSAADQEKQVYDEEKNHEVRSIKTTPYRSQAVVSPKPKAIHDHVQGSYLLMQHYADAPTHGSSPIPPLHQQHLNPQQQRMHETQYQHYVQQVDPNAASLGPIHLQYNSPIGLYSKENAINTLKQTHGTGGVHQAASGDRIRLLPDNVVMEGSERKLNLAASPTFRMVQAMEGPGRQHEPVQDRVYSPIPTYLPTEMGHDPQQSASFKSLQNSLLSHPKV